MGYSTIKLGTLNLGGSGNAVPIISKRPVLGTAKSISSTGIITLTPIPGKAKELQITITAQFNGSTKDSQRATLMNYEKNGDILHYEDGIDSFDVVIEPNSLVFDDTGPVVVYPYRITLRQY